MTTARFEDALVYAHKVHQGQVRKSTGIPYVAHILGVAAIAMEYGATEDEAIGALLHDAAEDGGGEETLAEIRAKFEDAVADIVLGCSDSLVQNPEEKLPWRERKEGYLAHLEQRQPDRCASCRPPTSCTTSAPSLATIAPRARRSGIAFRAGVTGRSGTTTKSPTRCFADTERPSPSICAARWTNCSPSRAAERPRVIQAVSGAGQTDESSTEPLPSLTSLPRVESTTAVPAPPPTAPPIAAPFLPPASAPITAPPTAGAAIFTASSPFVASARRLHVVVLMR